jgi:hypothetical protein
MKAIVALAVSIVLVGIFFCPMVSAFPTLPPDLQMVQPDPSLPKEISAFFGKWEGTGMGYFSLIVEKIDEEKASLYVYYGTGWSPDVTVGWHRYEGLVSKDRGKYKLSYLGRYSAVEFRLKGESLIYDSRMSSLRLKRVE